MIYIREILKYFMKVYSHLLDNYRGISSIFGKVNELVYLKSRAPESIQRDGNRLQFGFPEAKFLCMLCLLQRLNTKSIICLCSGCFCP